MLEEELQTLETGVAGIEAQLGNEEEMDGDFFQFFDAINVRNETFNCIFSKFNQLIVKKYKKKIQFLLGLFSRAHLLISF
jgi:hypothetical protein